MRLQLFCVGVVCECFYVVKCLMFSRKFLWLLVRFERTRPCPWTVVLVGILLMRNAEQEGV